MPHSNYVVTKKEAFSPGRGDKASLKVATFIYSWFN